MFRRDDALTKTISPSPRPVWVAGPALFILLSTGPGTSEVRALQQPARGKALAFYSDPGYVQTPQGQPAQRGQRVLFNSPVYVGTGTNSMTVEGWFMLRELGPYGVIISQDDGVGGNFKVFMNVPEAGPYLIFSIWGDDGTRVNNAWQGIIASSALQINQWYHFAGVIDRSRNPGVTLRAYFNGQFIREEFHPGPGTWNERLSIGNDLGDAWGPLGRWYWHGSLDEIRIYNRVLGPAEIAAHYNGGQGTYGQPEPGLLGGWHFDEGTGTVAQDYSGNGHHGTLVNGPQWVDGHIPVGGATPAADSDADGLPDSWEQTFFGNLNQTGSGDPDGDGRTNAQEYADGTNPNVSDTPSNPAPINPTSPPAGTGGGGGRENDNGDASINDTLCGALGVEALLVMGLLAYARRRLRKE